MSTKTDETLTFPHTIEDPLTGRSLSLYAEKDRASVTYRVAQPDGTREKKAPVPKSLGDDRQIPDDGVVSETLLEWGRAVLAGFREKEGEHPDPDRHNHVQLGYVFKRVRASGWYRGLSRKRREEVDLPMRWVESALKPGFWMDTWDADTLDDLFVTRTEEGVRTTNADGDPIFLSPCARNTAAKDLKNLKTVLERAKKLKYAHGQRDWLLDSNPLDRLDLPKPGVRESRVPIPQWRYEILMDYADEVDPTGRFRFSLVIARWVGRRVSTIRRMTRSVVLETEAEIRAALDQQLCTYVEPHDRDEVARLYAEAAGAFYIRWSMVKSGQSGDEDRVEQYDAVTPVHPVVMDEWRRYHDRYWRKLGLGKDDPLIPGEVLTEGVSYETQNEWFHAAELLAEKNDRSLKMPKGNAWHGFRPNRRTEYRRVHNKYARFLVGHSIATGTPGITVSEGRYLGIVPEDLVAAVQKGP